MIQNRKFIVQRYIWEDKPGDGVWVDRRPCATLEEAESWSDELHEMYPDLIFRVIMVEEIVTICKIYR